MSRRGDRGRRREHRAAPPAERRCSEPGPAECVDARPRRAVLAVMLAFTKIIQPNYGPAQIQGLAIGVLPVAFAAVAQAIVVISGGIDLSVASMMALTSVTAAVLLKGQGDGVRPSSSSSASCCWGSLVGAINGSLVVVTRVPGHRRHPRDVVRLGRNDPARPELAGRRRRRPGCRSSSTGRS